MFSVTSSAASLVIVTLILHILWVVPLTRGLCFPKCEHSGILVRWYLAAEGLKIILEEEVELFSPCCREYKLDCPGNEME